MYKRNIPNILSVFRIFLIPVVVYLFFADYPIYYALLVFLFAGLTDIIDGYLARKYNWITNIGKLLDPLADKMMQCAVLICLALKGIILVWIVFIFLLKEIFMIFGAILVLKKIKVTVKSEWYGKATTILIYITVVVLSLFRSIPPYAATILCTAVLVCAITSMIMYIIDAVRINSKIKNENRR